MGNTVDKVLLIAESEVGYLEKKSNTNLYDKTANAGSANYTKYGKEMHDIYPSVMDFPAAWCDAFVDWCFYKAYGVCNAKGLLCGDFNDYTPSSAQLYKNKKAWYTTPKVGDQIFFKNSTRINHTGLVYKVDSVYVYTIEGNTSGASGVIANGGGVCKKKYTLNNSKIAGYGRPKYDVMDNNSSNNQSNNSNNSSITSTTYTKKQCVKDIQSAIGGLTIDGLCGEKTLAKLPILSKSKNKKHKIVKYLQKYLNTIGFDCGTPDSDFGNKTHNAVISYQKSNGLIADGVVGKNTWKKLIGM